MLLDLAGRGLGQGHETDLARALEAGKMLATVLDQGIGKGLGGLIVGRCKVGPQLDQRERGLAPLRVGRSPPPP
jgi:hypothetical protein